MVSYCRNNETIWGVAVNYCRNNEAIWGGQLTP